MALEGQGGGFQGDMVSVPTPMVERAQRVNALRQVDPISMQQGTVEAPKLAVEASEGVYPETIGEYVTGRVELFRLKAGQDLDKYTGPDAPFGFEIERGDKGQMERFRNDRIIADYRHWKGLELAYRNGDPQPLREQLEGNAYIREEEIKRLEQDLKRSYPDDAAYEEYLKELEQVMYGLAETTSEESQIRLELRKSELLQKIEGTDDDTEENTEQGTQRGRFLKQLRSAQKNLDAMNNYLGQLPPAPASEDEA